MSSMKTTTDDANATNNIQNNTLTISYNTTIANYNKTSTPNDTTIVQLTSVINLIQQPSIHCIFPSYFSHFAVLILIAITIVTQLSHLMKISLMILITGKDNIPQSTTKTTEKTVEFYYIFFVI